ncbi:MAG: phage holin family protein [Ferruginibacter sp.]
MRLIINILITAVAVYVIAKLLSPHVVIDNLTTAIIFALVLGVLNFFVKPLITLLTLPLTIITLGLFLIVINVIIIMLADGISIGGFLWALIFGVLLSIISTVLNKLEKKWSL